MKNLYSFILAYSFVGFNSYADIPKRNSTVQEKISSFFSKSENKYGTGLLALIFFYKLITSVNQEYGQYTQNMRDAIDNKKKEEKRERAENKDAIVDDSTLYKFASQFLGREITANTNCFEILNLRRSEIYRLSQGDAEKQVNQRKRKLMLQYHPDRHLNDVGGAKAATQVIGIAADECLRIIKDEGEA